MSRNALRSSEDDMRWGRIPLLASRVFLGAVFLYASIDKILQPAAFADVIYNYGLLPDLLINVSAIILPWLELSLGLCLVFGLWMPGATFLSTLLLLTFFSAIVFNLARGLDIECGCFSTGPQAGTGAPMIWYTIRDGFFLLLALYLSHQTLFRRKFFSHEGRAGQEEG